MSRRQRASPARLFRCKIETGEKSRLLLKIFNDDTAANIFYGDSTVTASTGIPIPAGGESDWIPCSADIWVFSTAGGFTVRTLELA